MTSLRPARLAPPIALVLALVAGLFGAIRPAAAAPGPPDLSVSMTASPNPVTAGTSLIYRLTVSNRPEERCYQQRGEEICTLYGRAVSGVVVEFSVPPGATYGGAGGDHGFTCSSPWASLVRCVNGSLQMEDDAAIYVGLWAPPTAGTAAATARVDPANAIAERNESNNAASVAVTVNPPKTTDLAVTNLTATPNPASRNGSVTFAVTVRNVGSREADGVNVTLRGLPATSALRVTAGGDGNLWTCYSASDYAFDVRCHGAGPGCEIVCYGSIPAGATVTLQISATVTATTATNLNLQAEVSIDQRWAGYVDVSSANNTRTLALPIQ